jgi:SAM-dependent methyltransferase
LLLKKEFHRLKWEVPSQSVFLDIGCGAGELSRMIHEDNSQVIAIDNSSTKPCLIASLDSIPYRSIDYQSGIIIDLPKIKHGVIILRHVLEHLPHPDLFLGALLSQGGEYFYIAVPNHGHIGDRWWGVSYGHCDPPSHLWFFNKESLNVLLTRMGLEVVRSGYETIPTIIMSMDRYCALRGMPKRYCELLFNPRGVIGLMSMIFDFLLPNNVIWVIARKRR